MKQNSWETMDRHEKKKLVASLVAEGMTASQIAARFGPTVSRNAVIGFAHRCKITLGNGMKRSRVSVPAAPKKAKLAKTAPPATKVVALKDAKPSTSKQSKAPERRREHEPVISAVVVPFVRPAGPVSLLHLEWSMCRWPMNSSYRGLEAEEMLFCGKEKAQDGPYCSECVEKFKPFNGKASRGPKLNDDGTPYTSKRKRRPFLRWQG